MKRSKHDVRKITVAAIEGNQILATISGPESQEETMTDYVRSKARSRASDPKNIRIAVTRP